MPSWELHPPGTVHHSDQSDAGRGADSWAAGSFKGWTGPSLFFRQECSCDGEPVQPSGNHKAAWVPEPHSTAGPEGSSGCHPSLAFLGSDREESKF